MNSNYAKRKKNKYDNQYVRQYYHRISLNVRKEEYENIQKAAASSGMSVSEYLKTAFREKLERDAASQAPEPDSSKN